MEYASRQGIDSFTCRTISSCKSIPLRNKKSGLIKTKQIFERKRETLFFQGRQKLARYGQQEFNSFIYDILKEVCRRYHEYIQPSTALMSSPTKCMCQTEKDSHAIIAFFD